MLTTPQFAMILRNFFLLLFTAAQFFACQVASPKVAAAVKRPVEFVNPFIGTGGHGHTYPGATLPFGMVQLSPDTRLSGWDGCGGYHFSDSLVYGFSHTHLSGTGITDYGDVLLMPTVGAPTIRNGADGGAGYRAHFSKKNEIAKAGYYKTLLDDLGVTAELTATVRAGFHRYTFPNSVDSGNIVIDLNHRDKVLDARLTLVNDSTVEGFRVSKEWAQEQHIYFVAQFSKSIHVTKSDSLGRIFAVSFSTQKDKQILVRAGISAVSIAGAKQNLAKEIPHWDFDRTRNEASETWNTALKKIEVEGGSLSQNTIFYTALYHTMVVPNVFQDVDGKYRGMDKKIHQATDHTQYSVFSLWDTYRAAHPLYTILEPSRVTDFVKTFLAQYEQGGKLPVWELAANETNCMIGYHAVSVIADAYAKGIKNFDAEKALAAMQHSADQDDFGLKPYKSNDYIPFDQESESVSKTLEYAYDDWCISQMAKNMGKDKVFAFYNRRAQNYKNLFDPESGLFRGRANNTFFAPFLPSEVNFNYTEANAWQYGFSAMHDVLGWTTLLGGQGGLDEKLDSLFAASTATFGREQADITGLIGQYAHGNEPSHHIAYIYNFLHHPWKSEEKIHYILNHLYTDQPDGLIGNEDCGQMSAWYVMSAMGFYPACPGSPMYVIGTPMFSKVTIHLENDKKFIIKANNISEKNFYINQAALNGKSYQKSFFYHNDLAAGGELVFEMSDKRTQVWGIGENDVPTLGIETELIVPQPFVKNGKHIFKDSMCVELGKANRETSIYFTTDGSDPSAQNAKLYSAPFWIDKTTTLRCIGKIPSLSDSKTGISVFTKINSNTKVLVLSSFAPQYAAEGKQALVDGIRGGGDFRIPGWQGFEGIDLEAVVDLGGAQKIKKIGLSCLQDIKSWIFLPTEVTFFDSNDGQQFQQISALKNQISEQKEGQIFQTFSIPTNVSARFLKVVARNRGKVPEWHIGAGGKSWIFADEILIE